jgi:lipopolysaccharide/colanic/teichoic acid biosynthesis glycosyltransferase
MFNIKRVVDASIALGILIAVSPLLLLAAIGIKLTSPGPIFYRALRIGRDRRRDRREGKYQGRVFTMYKFRTMLVSADAAAKPITAWKDSRVFPFGSLLRATKIDELPQLLNVIKGDMALVGPRPEAPEIVRSHYSSDDLGTLQALPGVTSPGTLYYYTHCEAMLQSDAVADLYVQRLLPIKLALDRVYLRHPTLGYDVRMILRTIAVLVARCFGSRRFPDPPELAEAGVNGLSVPPEHLRSFSTPDPSFQSQPRNRI